MGVGDKTLGADRVHCICWEGNTFTKEIGKDVLTLSSVGKGEVVKWLDGFNYLLSYFH